MDRDIRFCLPVFCSSGVSLLPYDFAVKLQDRYEAAKLFVMHCSVPSTHVPKWADLSGYTVRSNFNWEP